MTVTMSMDDPDGARLDTLTTDSGAMLVMTTFSNGRCTLQIVHPGGRLEKL